MLCEVNVLLPLGGGGPEFFHEAKGGTKFFLRVQRGDQKRLATGHHRQTAPLPVKNDSSLTYSGYSKKNLIIKLGPACMLALKMTYKGTKHSIKWMSEWSFFCSISCYFSWISDQWVIYVCIYIVSQRQQIRHTCMWLGFHNASLEGINDQWDIYDGDNMLGQLSVVNVRIYLTGISSDSV